MIYEINDHCEEKKIAIKLFQRRMISNQDLQILLLELHKELQDEEAKSRLEN